MSFISYALPGSVYSSGEIQMIRRVVDALDRECLLPPLREEREQFFRHVLLLYESGHCSETLLLHHARAAAPPGVVTARASARLSDPASQLHASLLG